ncbi:MAG: spore germination protein GerPE [Bacillota bacterium]|uniref:Spore germination protein GerPE n=1 Tax=Virgibacillus salarius TaxID=447199 RepID=A0A941ICC6_9BACI|nr:MULTISPECIES: spore germination protein GerPE [Bacillaceae]NAZ10066.1 spore germination protein GerPE [Agaribacter marinus]MBR7797356.1 spore germination protein GerPE [Virgibacillus salarius]MCC2250826.1 spore germination protein GerPE [Virgibacillus sp. AGTR]MDY7046318.1 spore germination protein GerPE [Virgibacillus sp. M23]QRZ16499.1 spore germination protein GerPE [Virgibacillus sp. AGTR]
MQKRIAHVSDMFTNSVSFSGVVSIGDTFNANLNSKGIAVQKEGDYFTKADEEYFEDYPIFTRKANWLKDGKTVNKSTFHHDCSINVHHVSLIGVSSSSLMQIGSVENIAADARLKHFRKLQD